MKSLAQIKITVLSAKHSAVFNESNRTIDDSFIFVIDAVGKISLDAKSKINDNDLNNLTYDQVVNLVDTIKLKYNIK